MQIACTSLRFSPEDAIALSRTENNGLLGRAADFLRGGPPEIEVLSSKQFYYPYYCVKMRMQIAPSKRAKARALEANMVVDGVFGMVQGVDGVPQTEQQEIPPHQIAKIGCPQPRAAELAAEFVRKYVFRKYRAYPSFDSIETDLVYKPLYAVDCRKCGKQYYQIVDGEMGSKDYILDIRYPKVQFCAKEP